MVGPFMGVTPTKELTVIWPDVSPTEFDFVGSKFNWVELELDPS
jgi:hypothetical protein